MLWRSTSYGGVRGFAMLSSLLVSNAVKSQNCRTRSVAGEDKMKKLLAFLAMLGSLVVAYGLDWYIVELESRISNSLQYSLWIYASLGAMLLTIAMILFLFWLMVVHYPRSSLISLLYFFFGLLAPLFLIIIVVMGEQVGEYLSHPLIMTVLERFFIQLPDTYLLYTSLGSLLVGLISLIWAEESEYDLDEWNDDEEIDEAPEDEPAALEEGDVDASSDGDEEPADEDAETMSADGDQSERPQVEIKRILRNGHGVEMSAMSFFMHTQGLVASRFSPK